MDSPSCYRKETPFSNAVHVRILTFVVLHSIFYIATILNYCSYLLCFGKKNWLDFISALEYIKYMIYACHILAMDYTYSERSCVWRRRTTENLGSNLPAWYLPVGGTPLRYSIYHLLNVKS